MALPPSLHNHVSENFRTNMFIMNIYIYDVHFAGLLDVQNILPAYTGISGKLKVIYSVIT
jgi:hypothetical protein